MGEIGKVVLAAALGTFLGAYIEPKITAMLPASLTATGTAGNLVHAGLSGVFAGAAYWAIRKV